MSVRKSAARTASREMSGGAHALKSLGFWSLLAGASFIIGLFILSPLINAAAGSRTASTDSGAPAATAPAQQPSPQSSAPAVTPSKPAERRADSDVGISVEKPKPNENPQNPEIQKPLGVDDSATATPPTTIDSRTDSRIERRGRHRTGDETESATGRATDQDASPTGRATDDSTSRPDRGERIDDSRQADPTERASRTDRTDSANRDRPTNNSDESNPRRTRRTRRSRTGDETSPARDHSAPPTDVQKGDTIDR